jgi:hypothetical protein
MVPVVMLLEAVRVGCLSLFKPFQSGPDVEYPGIVGTELNNEVSMSRYVALVVKETT